MNASSELEALGWCASMHARIEFVALEGFAFDAHPDIATGEIAVRVEVLGFHPVVGSTLAIAVAGLLRDIDARDEARQAAQRERMGQMR